MVEVITIDTQRDIIACFNPQKFRSILVINLTNIQKNL